MRSPAILLLLVGAAVACGQTPVPNDSAGLYEGQTVSSLRVVANPHTDVEPLKSLVTLRPGSQFSNAQARASVNALKAAGHFSTVTLSVTPEIAGLHLTFVLEPAYYIGVIEFPQASKYFSYTRLLQVVNLPDEDPYDKGQLPSSQTALVNFFHSNGYFQAQVEADAQIDDANQVVNVTFHTQIGKRARIGNIEIEGTAGPESARLLHSVQSWRARFEAALLKPGKSYTQERMKRAIALMKKSLSRQRRLDATVRENAPQYHPETNRVDVSFHIEVGPEVTVRTTGAHLSILPFLSGYEARKLIPVYSEATVDGDLVEEGERNLIDYFQKKGFYDAKVNTTFQRQPDKILLVYEIDEGKRHKVENISFSGNRHLTDRDLFTQVTIKKSRLWTRGQISQKEVRKSAENLEAHYRDAGYEHVAATPQVTDHEPQIDVVFHIEEGPQTLVSQVQVNGNQSIPLSQLAPAGLKTRQGSPFSPHWVFNDRSRIAATYLDRGYLNAQVKTSISRDPGDPQRVNVNFEITEHQRVRISQVVYLGQKQTRLSLLEKTANLPPGSYMSQGHLLETESDIYGLDVFDWASVGPRKPITTQSDEEVLVKVHEAKRNEITYGFGFEVSRRGGSVPTGTVAVPGLPTIGVGGHQVAPSEASYASPRGSIEFTRHNLRGRAEIAAVSLLASRLDQSALATYADPRFQNSQWNSLLSISVERTTENPLYAASLGDASFQLERQLSKKTNTRLQLRYDFNKTYLSHLLVPELVLPQDRDVRLSTISGTLIRDTRDKPLDAHRGIFGTIDLRLTPVAFGSSTTFAKLFTQYAFYKPVRSMIWANSVRLGLAKAFDGSFVPTSQLFFSGGGTSLRGFPINEAGPQRIVPFCGVLSGSSGCVNITVPVGGRQLFILNSELRFPLRINKSMGGVVFYDGGNVDSAINFRGFVDNYSNTVGIGLRYATPVGPVRIDLGRDLNPVPGIGATQYFITIGQAF